MSRRRCNQTDARVLPSTRHDRRPRSDRLTEGGDGPLPATGVDWSRLDRSVLIDPDHKASNRPAEPRQPRTPNDDRLRFRSALDPKPPGLKVGQV
jgi:hypothetical protein